MSSNFGLFLSFQTGKVITSINQPTLAQFSVFDVCDGKTPVSGLSGEMIPEVFYNDEVSILPVQINEIDTTGAYVLQFTPDKVGFYMIRICVPSTEDVFECRFIAEDPLFLFKDIITATGRQC